MVLKTDSFKVSDISFCNKEASNIREHHFKKQIVDYLFNKYNVKICSPDFVRISPNILEKNLEKHQHLLSLKTAGNPYYFFLTKVNDRNCCFYIDQKIAQGYNYPRIIHVQYRFADHLFNDTLFNGELIRTYDNEWSFIINDIIIKEGNKIKDNIINKLSMIYDIFTNNYQPDAVYDICPLQVIKIFHYSEINYMIDTFLPKLGYNTKAICFHTLNPVYDSYIYTFSNDEKKEFFQQQSRVKEDKLKKRDALNVEKEKLDKNILGTLLFVKGTTDDLYQTYCHDSGKAKELGYAAIPTRRHSHNLRLIFDKNPGQHYFLCRYSNIFRKWIPIEESKVKKTTDWEKIKKIIEISQQEQQN